MTRRLGPVKPGPTAAEPIETPPPPTPITMIIAVISVIILLPYNYNDETTNDGNTLDPEPLGNPKAQSNVHRKARSLKPEMPLPKAVSLQNLKRKPER